MIRIEAFRQNLEAVQERIACAARSAGRSPEEIRLVVVSKGHSPSIIEEVLELGVRDLGESYAEEGLQKKSALADVLSGRDEVRWHMIGHVQSRKAGTVVEHFDVLHSLDSLKLARRLNRFAEVQGRRLPVLLQVNVSGEGSKHGWPAHDEGQWPQLFAEFAELLNLPGLLPEGLMTIPPIVQQPSEARPYFAKARALRDQLAERFPQAAWGQLSMGMSADYEAAILEGATIVRVGSAILGPRPNS